jgi:hypothetical protein
VLQNFAELAILGGKVETAALLLGFVDGRFETWADGRQMTEVMQRKRLEEQLQTRLGAGETAKLQRQGKRLSFFEAEVLAKIGKPSDDPSAR